MDIECDNALCRKVFRFLGGRSHYQRSSFHYCSRSCQNTTHGMAGTQRHKIWERARKRAKECGTVFTLEVNDIPEVPERCPILGIKIQPNCKAGPIDSSPSIDRIIANRGYVPGNVRIISNRANRIRSDATAAEPQALADDAARIESLFDEDE